MNTDVINRWLTLGANIGVVVGIIFLAFELQQNNELLQSQVSVTYVELRRTGLNFFTQNDELLRSVLKAREGEDLNKLEALRLDSFYRSVFVNWEWEYQQYEKEVLDVLEQPPNSRWRPAVNYYPLMRESWSTHKATMSPRFVKYMEEEVLN